MTAPLPLRWYNPVKEMCLKYNLDYETVIGSGLKKTRDAFINADFIDVNPAEVNAETRKKIKHKKEFYDRKYGTTTDGDLQSGEIEDKGVLRYLEPLSVCTVRDEPSEVDKSNTLLTNVGNGKNQPNYINIVRGQKWVPGRPSKNTVGGDLAPIEDAPYPGHSDFNKLLNKK
jgi:hypothetical protein